MRPVSRRRIAAIARQLAAPAAGVAELDALLGPDVAAEVTAAVKARLLEKHGGDTAKVAQLVQEVMDEMAADAAAVEAATAVGQDVSAAGSCCCRSGCGHTLSDPHRMRPHAL